MASPTGPPGTLLGTGHGTGPGDVVLAHRLPKNGTELTLRFTCVGSSTVKNWITDEHGGLILGTGGCGGVGVVYSSGWKKTSHDGKTIHVKVAPSAQWAIDVWQGNPPIKFQQPTQA
jgi:hypothetical protein